MLTLATGKVWTLCWFAQSPLGYICTSSYVRLACLGECYVGIAVRVRSSKALRGHGQDTTLVTTDWSAAAGLPTPLAITS